MNKIIFCISFIILATFFTAIHTQASSVRLIIDDRTIGGLPTPPMIYNNNVLVPARAVFEQMGGQVGWHAGHRQVTVYHGDHVLVMTIGSFQANLNGQIVTMRTAPMIYNDSTMIPLRFTSEAFGFLVDWDESIPAAIVNSPTNNNNADADSLPPIDQIPIITLPPVIDDDDYDELDNNEADDVSDENNIFDTTWHDGRGHLVDNPSESPTDEIPLPGATVTDPGTGNANLARDISTTHIATIPFPETSIISLLTPQQTQTAAYVIAASSAISEVVYFLLPDNRLVIDIHNASSKIATRFAATPGIPVNEVRTSQFSYEPRVTRVVFDIEGPAEFSVSLSADRTILTVAFSENRITAVYGTSEANSDTLFIRADMLPNVTISTEGFPHFLTINIDNARMQAAGGAFEHGVFARHFITGERADGSVYVQLFVGDVWPSFSLVHGSNTVAVMLHQGIQDVRYDTVNRELIISRANGFTMNIQEIVHIEEYLRYRYTLILPPQASVLGQGTISIFDGFINSVDVTRSLDGNVHMVFNTATILGFTVYETPTDYIIRAHTPRDLNQFIIVIDPGHGGSDPGAIHHGVVEKDLVLAVSHKVVSLLDANPLIRAYMTRHDDSSVSLPARAEFANALGADLFVAIHANAATRNTIHGIETWYTIGEREAERQLPFGSRHLASIMQEHMIRATGAHNRGLMNTQPNFVVLRDTYMPSVLLELGFLTNPHEAALLATSAYQWLLAQSIYAGIVEAFASHTPVRTR